MGGGFLSALLLLFFLVSCREGSHPVEGTRTKRSSNDPTAAHNQKEVEAFLYKLGGWGSSVTAVFLMNNLIQHCKENYGKAVEKRKNKNKNTKTINGQEVHNLPDEHPEFPGKKYFEALIAQKDAEVGDQEGRKKWFKMRARRKKQGVKVRTGIDGIFKQVVDLSLSSNSSFKRDTGIYVVVQYLKFVTTLHDKFDRDLGGITNKQEIIAILGNAFSHLKEKLSLVEPGKSGVRLFIPVGNEVEATEDNLDTYFVDRSEDGNRARGERKKNFTLNDAEQERVKAINEEIEKAMQDLERKLR